MSGSSSSICRLDDDINSVPVCDSQKRERCRPPDALNTEQLTIPAGGTKSVPYHLRAGITGNVFATAGTIDGQDNITAAVKLTMGVSPTGIPLSPVTLVLPYYAQFLDPDFVSNDLQLLGLGYSLATAPLNTQTAKFPRVIKTDVFRRAVDISRAGQRIFIGEAKGDSYFHLALDLLGNGDGNDLVEWDQLRRQEYSGRVSGGAVGAQLSATALANASDFDAFLAHLGPLTSYRAPFLAALVHGNATAGRPYALSLRNTATNARTELPDQAATESTLGTRDMPWSDLISVTSADKSHVGELAIEGRWQDNIEVIVTPAAGASFKLDLLYPSATAAHLQHAVFDIQNASGNPLSVIADPAAGVLRLVENLPSGATGASWTATPSDIAPAPLAIVAMHQDLHLDDSAHMVSVLFNRPVSAANDDYRSLFDGAVDFTQGTISYHGKRGIDSAARQSDGRTINLTFDHSLSKNATYKVTVVDPLTGSSTNFGERVPLIDNDRAAGIIFGHVYHADNTPVIGSQVILYSNGSAQYDTAQDPSGAFLFEYIRRDPDVRLYGNYHMEGRDSVAGKVTSVDGAVRLPGVAETVNLVFLGRGSATGVVTYDNGQRVAGARVVVGSTMFDQFRSTTTDANGNYSVSDLPVGPLTRIRPPSSGRAE